MTDRIGVFARESYRNTGIETFEENVVPWLLEEIDGAEPIYFEPRDSYPLSITIEKLTAGRRLKKKIEGFDKVFIFSQDRVVFDPASVEATVVPYVHDLIPVTGCYKSFSSESLLDRFADYPSTVMATRYVKFISNCEYAITSTDTVREELEARTAFDGKSFRVYQGVDDKDYREDVSGKNRKYDLIYIGSAIDRKCPEFVIDTFEKASEQGFETVYVNHGKTAISGHADHEFYDVEDETVSHLLSNTNYYLHPSMAEGFGRGPVEAQMNGCLPVARGLPINHEVLGDGDAWIRMYDELPEFVAPRLLAETPTERERKAAVRNAKRFKWEDTRRLIKQILTRDVE